MPAVMIVSITLSSLIALAAGAWEHRQAREHKRGVADRESVRNTLAETTDARPRLP